MNKEISVELTGWNREEQIFEFDVYRAGTDEVLASYDVKNGYPYCFSLIEENGLQKESSLIPTGKPVGLAPADPIGLNVSGE